MLSQLCLKSSSGGLYIKPTTTSAKRLEVVVARPAGHNYYTCLAVKATTSQIKPSLSIDRLPSLGKENTGRKPMIVKGFNRTKEYTGMNPVLVEGFDRVNGSQRTRWITQTLSRLSCEP